MGIEVEGLEGQKEKRAKQEPRLKKQSLKLSTVKIP